MENCLSCSGTVIIDHCVQLCKCDWHGSGINCLADVCYKDVFSLYVCFFQATLFFKEIHLSSVAISLTGLLLVLVIYQLLLRMSIFKMKPAMLRARLSSKKIDFQNACQSKEQFHKYIQTKDSDTAGHWSWINEGLTTLFVQHHLMSLTGIQIYYRLKQRSAHGELATTSSSIALWQWIIGLLGRA